MQKQNTKHGGILRFFIYYDTKDKEFVGFCVDLGIVKTGTNPFDVQRDLEDAAMGYVKVIHEDNLPDYLLNQKLPQQYLNMFESFMRAMEEKQVARRSTMSFDQTSAFVRQVHELCPMV